VGSPRSSTNFGFFTLLAYTPFALHLGIHELGYTFTAWGLLLAIFAVFVAPPPAEIQELRDQTRLRKGWRRIAPAGRSA
jgi:hypothetical protein